MRLSQPVPTLLGCALVFACGDQSLVTEPAGPSEPSFRTEQSPEGPGAFAVHVPEASFITAGFEPEPGLTALIGATYADHLHFCETGEPPFPMDRLLVFRPDGSIMTRVQGAQVPLVVWQTAPLTFTGDILADTCTEEFLALPHLEGTGQFLDRDNDLTGSGNRGNAFGTRIVGQVSSESGDRFHFMSKGRSLILPSGERRDFFEIELRPIGQ
jgi:hypothetical protein